MHKVISNAPKGLTALAALVGIIGVGVADFLTGFDISLSVFYALGIIVAVWSCGRGVGILASLLAVGLSSTADFFSGHNFSTEWVLLWNALVRFSFYMLVVAGAHHTIRHLELTTARAEALEQVLPVCTCCKRIADEHGAWVEVETYLSETLSTRPAMKVCPDCSRKVYIDKVAPSNLTPAKV